MKKYRFTALTILAMILLISVTYSNTLDSPFIFDDKPGITDNTTIRITDLSVESITKLLASRSPRPVANVSFALNYLFGGYQPPGYHVVNMAIHIINGILLLFFLKITLNRMREEEKKKFPTPDHIMLLAVFAPLIWIVNPLNTNSVTYLVQRMNSLAALFYLSSLLFYIKGRSLQFSSAMQSNGRYPRSMPYLYYGVSLLSGCLAVGSKENALILPFCILLYDLFFFREIEFTASKNIFKILVITLCSALAVFIGYFIFSKYSGVTFTTAMNHLYSLQDFTLFQRILTEFRVIIYYIGIIFLPYPSRLNLDHQYPISFSLVNPITTLICLIAIIGLVFTALIFARKERLLSFTILWFLGNLIIESSFIPLALIYEHRTYMPSMMLSLLLPLLLFRNLRSKRLASGISVIIILFFSLWTYQRNAVWKDEISLWQDCVAKAPNRARPLSNLGIAFASIGDMDKAIDLYYRSLNLKQSAEIQNNLGNALVQKGQSDEAIVHYNEALKLDPAYINAHINLGNTYAELNQLEKALYHYAEVQKKSPDDVTLLNNMGKALFKGGRLEEAEKCFRRVLQKDPENWSAYNSLGLILARQKKFPDAAACFKKAQAINPDSDFAEENLKQMREYTKKLDTASQNILKQIEQDPNNPLLRYQLGKLYQDNGLLDQSVEQYQKTISIQPEFTDAIYQLAIVYAIQKKPDAAVNEFEKLIQIQPDNSKVEYNIACLYSRMGKKEQAITWLGKAIRHGYNNWHQLQNDPDLNYIRDTDFYQNIIQ